MSKKNRERRRGKPSPQSEVAVDEVRQRFLIVCEGEKTEPNYFESFKDKIKIAVDVDIEGFGYNTISLVKKAISLMAKSDYAQVWCVFDRDEHAHFNAAIQLAQNKGIRVAYSNEAFELWYLLHFEYLNTGISRKDYITKLRNYLDNYEKNDPKMYDKLLEHQQKAIQNAKTLLNQYAESSPPADNNPSTTVHLLVEELNRFLRD